MSEPQEESSSKRDYIPHPQVPSPLGRFIKRFQDFIQGKPQVEIQLRERKIRELEVHADDIMQSLLNAKEELASNVDKGLYQQIEAVIDPIIWEVRQIQKDINKTEQTLNKYNSWIQKATLWVNLCSRFPEKQAIKEALLSHFTRESHQVIEGDIKVISDYLQDALKSIGIEEEKKKVLEEGVEKQVAPFIAALEELKETPTALTLEKVNSWRKKVDVEREKNFNGALHTIDEMLETLAIKENTHQVPQLREEVEALLQLLQLEMNDQDRCIAFERHLRKLEEDLDMLGEEAHLFPDTQDKLRLISEQIILLRKDMQL